jgi:ubiquinol-cytochrome c reductase subunit 6
MSSITSFLSSFLPVTHADSEEPPKDDKSSASDAEDAEGGEEKEEEEEEEPEDVCTLSYHFQPEY